MDINKIDNIQLKKELVKLKDNNIVIQCEEDDEAKQLFTILQLEDVRWISGKKLETNRAIHYNNEYTCYGVRENPDGTSGLFITNIEWLWIDFVENVDVILFKDFLRKISKNK